MVLTWNHFQILTSVLHQTSQEAQAVLTLLEHHELLTLTVNVTKHSARVKFKEDVDPLGATSFLHAFSYRTLFSNEDSTTSGTSIAQSSSSSSKQMQITVSKEASEERRLALGMLKDRKIVTNIQ